MNKPFRANRKNTSLPAGVALFVISIALTGCGLLPPKPVNADISNPKSTAMAYLKAVAAGDARTAEAVSTGTSDQMKWVEGRAALVEGMRQFDGALYAKFGHRTSQVHTDMHDSLLKLADFWIVCISDGKVNADEQNAFIEPVNSGYYTKFVNTIYLRREKAGWKVDLARTYADGASPDQTSALTDDARQWRQYGDAFRAVARDIKSGKCRSEDQASAALVTRMQALQN